MDIYVVDIESFYSKEYSLTKLTTQQYIDDPQFEVIVIAVKKNQEPAVWCSGTNLQIEEFLAGFEFENAGIVAHNALFDMSILSWQFDIKPKLIIDTHSMARAVHGMEVGNSLAKLAEYYNLGAKGTEVVNALGKRRRDFSKEELAAYAAYCINDVDLTYELFKKLAPHFNKTEIKLIDMTVRMHSEPRFDLDVLQLETHLYDTKKRNEELLASCGIDKADLMSNAKFASILKGFGVTPPTKISPRTGKETYAFAKTDEAMQQLAEHFDPEVQAIVAARIGAKSTLEVTRTERFLDIAKVAGVLPIPLKYYGAMTGRWSGSDSINMQNLPRGSALKAAIVAPRKHVIVGADLSNIELRVGLYFAGQMEKLQLLADGYDLYKDFAADVFNVSYDEVDSDQRFIGKTSQLSLIYGTGNVKLRAAIKAFSGVDIGEEMAQSIVTLYRTQYAAVKALWYQGQKVLEAIKNNQGIEYGSDTFKIEVHGKDGILLPSGLYLRYPDLREEDTEYGKGWTYAVRKARERIHPPKVFQNCTQALARCVMGEAMVRINQRYPVALTIHDACYTIAPENQADEALAFVIKEMCRPPSWAPELPLGAEGGYGKSLKDC
jgi:DNA polymerase